MLVVALLFGAPFAFMVALSLQPEGHALAEGPLSVPTDPRFENYAHALAAMGSFPRLLGNTLLVTVLSIAGQLATCSMAGYALARLRFRGRGLCFVCVLASMMIPEQVAVIPRFLLFRTLGLVDTFGPLILPTVLGGAPLFIFLFRQYFRSMTNELGEAAAVDGCGPWRTFWSVYLPLARPMLVTVGLFTFLATWNDFWAPLIYLISPEKQTLTLALASFNRTYDTAVEHLLAATAVVLAPCALIYFLSQRFLLGSIRVSASKH